MPLMRAKFVVAKVEDYCGDEQSVQFHAVTDGNPEDNTFAKYTPAASLQMTIGNPELVGKIKEGQKFYVDFTEAE